ncbi:unnamed protein product [Heterobilharzia americana]|nr:unnamed protein product [Heterobilharzia americana]
MTVCTPINVKHSDFMSVLRIEKHNYNFLFRQPVFNFALGYADIFLHETPMKNDIGNSKSNFETFLVEKTIVELCGQDVSDVHEHDTRLSSPKEQNRSQHMSPVSERLDLVDTQQKEVLNTEAFGPLEEKMSDRNILSASTVISKHENRSSEPEEDDGEIDDDDDDKDDEDDDNEDDDDDENML